MIEKNILTASGKELISTGEHRDGKDDNGDYQYDGYIQSDRDEKIPNGVYLKVVFTIEEIPEDDAPIFIFQPFNTAWGGWQENPITFGEAIYDSAADTYSAYISISEIKQTLEEGVLKGINISFAQAEPKIN